MMFTHGNEGAEEAAAHSGAGKLSRWYYCFALAVFAAGDAGFLLAFVSRQGMLSGDPALAHLLAGGEDPMLVGFAVSFTSIAAALAIGTYAYLMSRKEDTESGLSPQQGG